MGTIPMQQWYPDAHIADTALLKLEEQGEYRLLLDHMWIKGGYLKDDDKEVARLLRISTKKWQKIKPKLIDYLIFCEGSITQKRLQRDYKNVCERSKQNAENGRTGGLKTAENWKTLKANAPAQGEASATAKRRGDGSPQKLSGVLEQLEL